MQLKDGPHDVVYFFRKPTFPVQISIDGTSNVLLTVAILLDTGASLNLTNKESLQSAWKEAIEPIKVHKLWMVNSQVVNVEGIIYLIIHIGNLRVRNWFEIDKKMNVEVLLEHRFWTIYTLDITILTRFRSLTLEPGCNHYEKDSN